MLKKTFLTLLVVFISWLLGFVIFAYKINNEKVNSSHQADAIIIFSGGKNRITAGLDLFKKNVAERVFISGVGKNATLNSILKHNNIEIEDTTNIEIGKVSRTTVENVFETREWILEHKIKSIYLVTSNYHMPRSISEFRHLNPDIKIYPLPVFSENLTRKWWSKIGTAKLIFSEYNKFLFVKLNHQIYNFIGD